MRAEITYNGGRSYLVMGVKFHEGQTRVVSDPKLIEYCQHTADFAVQVIKEKVVREVVPAAKPKAATPVEEETEEAPRRKPGARKSE